jgi:phage protein U
LEKRWPQQAGRAMAWILMLGMALTGLGILTGLYLPILASQFVAPEKIRRYAIAGAVLVLVGTALEIVSVWPIEDVEAEQSESDQLR